MREWCTIFRPNTVSSDWTCKKKHRRMQTNWKLAFSDSARSILLKVPLGIPPVGLVAISHESEYPADRAFGVSLLGI